VPDGQAQLDDIAPRGLRAVARAAGVWCADERAPAESGKLSDT
jgi:hypothetical protein